MEGRRRTEGGEETRTKEREVGWWSRGESGDLWESIGGLCAHEFLQGGKRRLRCQSLQDGKGRKKEEERQEGKMVREEGRDSNGCCLNLAVGKKERKESFYQC